MLSLYGLWTRQLLREFEDICWTYGLQLSTPAFEISQSEKIYGSWHPDIRTIRISANLITSFSWDTTLQVLKHEMAHQCCSEVFGNRGPSHGKPFQKACDILGVPPHFRRSGSDLAGEVATAGDPSVDTMEGRKYIAKVEKLLSLARSDNRNEAVLAMDKASQLMEKYNLQEFAGDDRNGYDYTVINHRRKRLEGYQRKICTILQEFFYVQVVLSRLYDPVLNEYHKTVELLGRRENVEVARYCYFFLENQLPLYWKKRRTAGGTKGIRARNSFYLGLLEGFRDTLREQERLRTVDRASSPACRTRSLICLEADPGLQKFMGERHPRLAKGRSCVSRVEGGIFSEGQERGRTIVLHRGLTEMQGDRGRMIE